MKIVVTGSHGFIAQALLPSLVSSGHTILRLVRSTPGVENNEYSWDPYNGKLDTSIFDGVDAVIHLGGESIAAGRWTTSNKQRILESRTIPTRFLADTLASCTSPPKTFICASAIGYYGDRGEEIVTEESSPGTDFLANVCREWEAATSPVATKGVRVVNLRFGLILSKAGGALAKLLLPFKFGVGGKLGSGNQYWSWISIDDVIGIIHHALMNQSVRGPVNIVSMNAVMSGEFTKILGKVLSRPAIVPAPAFALRLMLGEMADALLLSSARVHPKKLLDTHYNFQYTDLEGALQHLLGKSR